MKRRPRLDRRCYLGERRYFLTFCTFNRHAAFIEARNVSVAQAEILRASSEHAFAVIAYVFMPEHVHLLAEGRCPAADAWAFEHLAKQRSAFEYARATGRRLWQPSYHDRILRDEESTWDVVHYICANPVRRGLVERWEDYPFLGSGIMSREEFVAAVRAQPYRAWQP